MPAPVRQRIRNPRSNVPPQNLKWSLDRASREFKLAPQTLRKYLHQADVDPDDGGCYSTEQLCKAIFGDLRAERLRKERQLTRKYTLENEVTEGNLLDRTELMRTFALIADAMVSRINAATDVPRNVREDLLRDLSTWPESIKEVVSRQSKLPRSRRDGQEEGDD
jgi:hypothetical protein